MHTPRPRGLQASHGPNAYGVLGDNIRVRISSIDKRLIERTARDVGMSKAEFCRWCAVLVAEQMDKQHGDDNDT